MAAPPQLVYTTQAPQQREGYCENYNSRGGMVTGIIQLICGVIGIIVGAVAFGVLIFVLDSGVGIWSGIILYIPAGILGIVSKNKNRCLIIAYMVMSILACIESLGVLCAEAYYAWFWTIVCAGGNCSSVSAYIAVQAIMAIVAVAEFVSSLTGSIFCCQAVCCGAPTV